MIEMVLGGISLATWIYLLVGRGGFWRARDSRAGKAVAGRVIAVIPARNEGANIGAAVASLTHQATIIVVDDHSTDDTARLAREAGATVISAAPLPDGWTGKMWAVQQGVEAALRENPDYLLLTDADIVHSRDNVTQLVGQAASGDWDLVSLMVELRMESLAERMLMPAFVFFFLMLYPPSWIANPKRKTAGAAGGCMLVRPAALRRAGGIEAIRSELIDDCALAAAVKRSGGKVWLGLTRETRSVREYPRFGDVWRMISRTAFTQLRYSVILLAGTILGLVVTYLVPPLLITHGWPAPAAWALMSLTYLQTLRYYRRSILWAPLLPAVALFYLAATCESAVRYWTGKGGTWKGRAQAHAAH
ncbi:MAG TPA: glycosyltransferase [Bryobacteraceae bacterium]|nr:glycosyltransferase [Bryobacteraceae bacterium]